MLEFINKFLEEIFSSDKRPPNSFMWKGQKTTFFNQWWLKFNSKDNECFSFMIGVNNPWDTEGKYHSSFSYIFFDRYSEIWENNLMSMPMWPVTEFKGSREKFEVEIKGSKFTEKSFTGSFYDKEHAKEISFDLQIKKVRSFTIPDMGVDGLFRGTFLKNLWHAPQTDCLVSGEIKINEETFKFKDDRGYQDTAWGSGLVDRWFWGHCNKFDEDPQASILVGGSEPEILGIKIPRIINDSFPILVLLHYRGKRYFFNSVLNKSKYHLDKGVIRIETTKRIKGIKIVYESIYERKKLRPMDWHSPDDTILESGMMLIAPATLKIYRRKLGAWGLEATLTTKNAAGICGGAKMDRTSKKFPVLRNIFGPVFMLFYGAVYFIRGTILGMK